MARRSDHNREELTELALEKGHEIISKNGISAFSARKAAAAMGYAVGTIYHVFGTLDDYLLRIHGLTLDMLQAEISADHPPRAPCKLTDLALRYYDFAQHHSTLWLALFEHKYNGPLPQWYKTKLSALFAEIETAVTQTTNIGHPASGRIARELWAGIHGICVLSLSGKIALTGGGEPQDMIRNLVSTYLAGIKAA